MTHHQETSAQIHPWIAEGSQRIRAGIQFMDVGDNLPLLQARVQEAEALGYDSVWVADHPTILGDCWTTLTALAQTTKTIRLGSLVSCVYYRHPLLLARIAADVDRLSGGRLALGLGIGDFAFEFAYLGLPFPSPRERQEYLAETIQVIKGVWGREPFTFEGKYIQVSKYNLPFGPVQQSHVPILIAGGGEKVTLRQVAEYADISNFGAAKITGGATNVEDIRRKLAVLDGYCETAGRPARSVLRSHITLPLVLAPNAERLAAKLERIPHHLRELFKDGILALTTSEAQAYYTSLVEAGLQYFMLGILPFDNESLNLFAQEILPTLSI